MFLFKLSFTMKIAIILLILIVELINGESPNGYGPANVQCPSGSNFLRQGNDTSGQEKSWIKNRQKKTNEALIDFLKSSNLTNFDAEKFIDGNDSNPINIGLAFSGGGYRAMLSGAGQLAGLDNRTSDMEDNPGFLGGILQSASYISSLSGGSWLVGSLTMQNWPSVEEVVFEDPNDVWNLTETRQLVNESTSQFSLYLDVFLNNVQGALTHLNNWPGIAKSIAKKENAGYGITITDYWSRGLAYQLFPSQDNYYESASFSDIRNLSVFENHDMPFPIVLAVGRKPGTVVYNLNSTVIEFNPFEMGSFDPALNSFTDIKYIGTKVNNGKPVQEKNCTIGFDNTGFVLGTSSSLFNQYLNTLFCEECNSLNFIVKWIGRQFLTRLSKMYEDIAEYKPNPFYNSQFASSDNITTNDTLYLIDGGLGGEVIPLSTLMTKQRKLDVTFAFDNSNDLDNYYPNGSALINTYERQFTNQGKSQLCPYVPNAETFLQYNLTAKPAFFGCDAKNLTDLAKDGVIPPLVIYIANRPFQFASNTSTMQLTYTDDEKKQLVTNGFDTITRLNGTIDQEWKTCVACAIIRRSQERQNIEQSDQCKKCFQRYCWNGTVATKPKSFNFNYTIDGLTKRSSSHKLVAKITSSANLKKINNIILIISTLLLLSYI